MKRREFLASLAAIPAVGAVKPTGLDAWIPGTAQVTEVRDKWCPSDDSYLLRDQMGPGHHLLVLPVSGVPKCLTILPAVELATYPDGHMVLRRRVEINWTKPCYQAAVTIR